MLQVFDPAEVAQGFGARVRLGPWKATYNLAPSQPALVLRSRGGQVMLEPMSWGLGRGVINLRAENLGRGRWGALAREGFRCLVPANGFYEWAKGPAQPYLFTPAGGGVLFMAGVYDPYGESFAVLTTAANELVGAIHTRMPALLEPPGCEHWLLPTSPWPAARGLLRPAPANRLRCQPVSRRLNRPGADGPGLLDPGPYQPRLL